MRIHEVVQGRTVTGADGMQPRLRVLNEAILGALPMSQSSSEKENQREQPTLAHPHLESFRHREVGGCSVWWTQCEEDCVSPLLECSSSRAAKVVTSAARADSPELQHRSFTWDEFRFGKWQQLSAPWDEACHRLGTRLLISGVLSMGKASTILALFVLLTVGLTWAVPMADLEDTAYDESGSLPYEAAPALQDVLPRPRMIVTGVERSAAAPLAARRPGAAMWRKSTWPDGSTGQGVALALLCTLVC